MRLKDTTEMNYQSELVLAAKALCHSNNNATLCAPLQLKKGFGEML